MAKRTTGPRETAWRLLRAVWGDGAYANLAWSEILRESTLSDPQRGFATDLAYGTLRYSGTLDRIVEAASGRTRDSVDAELWWILQLGAYQVLLAGVPIHAAVDESVTLAHTLGLHRGSGLVNAVMRKVSGHTFEQWCERLTGPDDSDHQTLGLRFAHPTWVVDAFEAALGEEFGEEDTRDELVSLLAAHNTPPAVTLAVLPGVGEILPTDHRTPHSPCGVVAPPGDPKRDSRVASGVARVQDEGSQLAALLLTRASTLREGSLIVDACSGPGGKAALIAADAARAHAHLVALEKHPHRAELVRQALNPFAEADNAPHVEVTDAVDWLSAHHGEAERILLDAPCLGLGSLRRRVESRWTKSRDDLPALVALQRELLTAAGSALAPGGILLYVTCSPVVEETTEQVRWVESEHPELEVLDTPALLDQVVGHALPRTRRGQAVQLWPHRHHTDAMFMQAFRQRG